MKQLNINVSAVTLGSDPEFGVQDGAGIPRSIAGLLGGTKKQPVDMGEGLSKQEDGVGAELCIPPCKTAEEYSYFILRGKELITEHLQQNAPDYRLVSVSSQHYSAEELNSPQAMEFGCEPSYDIYDDHGTSRRPRPEDVGSLRSFGFHVHIGYECEGEMIQTSVERIIQAMDMHVGIPSLIIDTDTERRQIYGNPGDYRWKRLPVSENKYIFLLEYRTLGGAMHSTKERIEYVFNQTMKAIETANNWNEMLDSSELKSTIQDIFKTHDLNLASAFISDMNIEVLQESTQKQEVYA